MHYSLELSHAGVGGDAWTLAELAALAETAGWAGVFLEEYGKGPERPGFTRDEWPAP